MRKATEVAWDWGAMRLQGTLEVEGEKGSQRTACVGTEDLLTPNFSLGSLLGFRATRPLLSATTCTSLLQAQWEPSPLSLQPSHGLSLMNFTIGSWSHRHMG